MPASSSSAPSTRGPDRLYNREQTRLIEPDVVFVKRGGEWVVSMNEEDLPSLRLSQRYRRMLIVGDHRQGSQGLCEGAVPLRAATDAQYRPAQEHHPAHLRGDCAPPAGFSRARRRGACAP